ncbi:uncharacterized protein LOC114284473 [Camellia sinensis]|uniref:uncharacterized protein LOC114284473 n=1 Tax=Camellia sinensis TaxID=4442 RepID=UPI00103579F1|nr:uncharacterized protein LOC114284473 [Camellia sinensis]
MHNPTVGHYAGVKRLLRFVKGTLSHGRTYTPSSFDLQAYSDPNWARDSVDRKSTFGYCVFLGSNLISWSAKKQATVSRSSTEAEYQSLAHTAAELACLLADIFTKPLSVSRFSYLKDKLMYVPPSISLWRNVEDHSSASSSSLDCRHSSSTYSSNICCKKTFAPLDAPHHLRQLEWAPYREVWSLLY